MRINFLGGYDSVDVDIDGELILHINKNDEGYSFDIYEKKSYNQEDYDEGYLAGTYVHFNEYEKE